MLGRETRGPIDLLWGSPEPPTTNSYDEFVETRAELMSQAYALAREQLGTVAYRSK